MEIAGNSSERRGRVGDIHQVDVAGQDNLHCVILAMLR
jgi:hypothetical protein